MRFLKMHGLGNDFVVIDVRDGAQIMNAARAQAIGDRHKGVGFDQLVTIHADAAAAARLVFWNADGSTAGACGNATRCVAALLMRESGQSALSLRTERGVLSCEGLADGRVRVDMGPPIFGWAQIPLAHEVDACVLPLEGAPASCSMGNPHCTYLTDDVSDEALLSLGPATETHPLFPQRTNVQLLKPISRMRARMRVWERGVGVTLASGSSSCAALVNAVRRGVMDRRATLELDGGEIEIEWPDDQAGVMMTGPTATVFEGAFTPEFWNVAQ